MQLVLLLGLLVSLWQPIQEKVLKADINPGGNKQKTQLVKAAIKMADTCIVQNPEEVGCYYYRAQATGLYYETVYFGYQKGIRSMIVDWQKSLDLDPKFDHGGPDRMLGELYTSLPKYFGTKDIRQDLEKARGHLQKSIAIAPKYPTQHIDLAETYIKMKKKNDAVKELEIAQNLMPQWTEDPYYTGWQERVKELEKEIEKLK